MVEWMENRYLKPHLHLEKQFRLLPRNRWRRYGRNETKTNMGNFVKITSFLAVLQRQNECGLLPKRSWNQPVAAPIQLA
jgi:hypothetical protein